MFSAEILHSFPTYQYLQKSVQGFSVLFRFWVIDKPGVRECVKTDASQK